MDWTGTKFIADMLNELLQRWDQKHYLKYFQKWLMNFGMAMLI